MKKSTMAFVPFRLGLLRATIGPICGLMFAVWVAIAGVQAADEEGRNGGSRSGALGNSPAAPAQGAEQSAAHPLDEVIAFAQPGREALANVQDYVAVFTKTELVGNRMVQQSMNMKFRQRPFSVYFRFRTGAETGREVIYVAGANAGNLIVHETGIKAIAGTLSLRPNDPKVMEENRYPITNVGIGKMLETAFEIWESEKVSDPANVEVKFYPNAKLGQTECQAVEIKHHQQQRGLRFHLSQVYFDKKTKLPVHAERYAWPRRPGEKPPLVERYSYSSIRTNVGLTAADFDPRNPEYGY